MKKAISITALSLVLFSLVSCQTYYMSVDSFKQQFAGKDSSGFKAAMATEIHCMDKNNRPYVMKIDQGVQLRFTDKRDNQTVFYFDTMFVTDTTVEGGNSRFLPRDRATIKLNTVTKIEVQQGDKTGNLPFY